jgi:hypothetical protein
VSAEPHDAVVSYPGAIRVRYRWAGAGGGPAVFALSEAGGTLTDLGDRAGAEPERLCRAEVRAESPAGAWTARLASVIYDEPAGLFWDAPGLLLVKYGFHAYGFAARSGELRWLHRSASPLLVVIGSSRLDHVVACSEVETTALGADGAVAWRVAHSDVVAAAELVGGRLVLTSYTGQVTALDPLTGRTVA